MFIFGISVSGYASFPAIDVGNTVAYNCALPYKTNRKSCNEINTYLSGINHKLPDAVVPATKLYSLKMICLSFFISVKSRLWSAYVLLYEISLHVLSPL